MSEVDAMIKAVNALVIDAEDKNRVSKRSNPNTKATKNNNSENRKGGEKSGRKRNKKNRNKKPQKKRARDDRFFGRFSCKICNRHWDSAWVFTFGGTKIVKFKQRCKNCDDEPDAWCFPYSLQILSCGQCRMDPCECTCEDCGKLKHIRYKTYTKIIYDEFGYEKSEKSRDVDTNYKYCRCEKRKAKAVGDKIDPQKHHLPRFCQRCIKLGRPCSGNGGTDDEA